MSGSAEPATRDQPSPPFPDRRGYTASTRPASESARWFAAAAEQAAARWPLGRITGAAVLVMALFSMVAIAVAGTALADLGSARNQVTNVIDPASQAGKELAYALVSQETGVRGYLLSGQQSFLAPYTAGLADQRRQVAVLRRLMSGSNLVQSDLTELQKRTDRWRSDYAAPAISQVAAVGKPVLSPDVGRGKVLFDSIRGPLNSLQADIATVRKGAVASLNRSGTTVDIASVVIAVVLLLVVAGVALGLRATAIRPLTKLASEARRVAAGDFEHEVTSGGPREAADLALDVNRMRERILRELSAVQAANATLQARAHDLERSNAELEQFAYVASHDLQEPLRKVASFCQLLQRRYIGQLDARADQYIEFAVDGAKRMQVLIDDLLAFSRVGRVDREPALISCASAVSAARVNLAAEIKKTGAVIETDELPVIRAEFSLITSLFQNLIGNAIKFRSDQPPRILISVQRQDEFWLYSIADNGIGIDPEYADRIFVIFQRLHDRASYSGTGIGLAMCRKIVEYYGGRIWLETTASAGATFRFTLPLPPEDEETT
jgi:signal transduction histidine kinase